MNPFFVTERLYHRYFTEDVVDPIAVTAGLVQTGLYIDFFYVYFTKWAFYMISAPNVYLPMMLISESSRGRSSSFRHEFASRGLSEPADVINVSITTNRSWTFMYASKTIESAVHYKREILRARIALPF